MSEFQIGDRVKLTGKFLKNTGQQRGSAGLDTFTVTGFDGNWVITDQLTDSSIFTAEELAEDPTLRYRRIGVANLYKVGTLTRENCP